MKIKYLAAVAAASVLGLTTLTSCGPSAEETAPDAVIEEDGTMEEGAMEDPAMEEGAMEDPAADPCAADPEG